MSLAKAYLTWVVIFVNGTIRDLQEINALGCPV